MDLRSHINISAGRKALEENLTLLTPERYKTLHNLTLAHLCLLQEIVRIGDSVANLHNKIQPLLKYVEEDNRDNRARYARYDPDQE